MLSEGLLDSPYSLTQVRVMYEIAHRSGVTAGELAEGLDLDRGYLSRMLKGFGPGSCWLVRRHPKTDAGNICA